MKAWMREAVWWAAGLAVAIALGAASACVIVRTTSSDVAAADLIDMPCSTSSSDDECYECTQCQAGARTIVVCQNVCEPEQETLHQEPRGFRL